MGNKDTVTPIPGESRASYIKRWKTRQKQLADYAACMAKAPQRTLDEWSKEDSQ